jgi:hypothetical protein
VFFNYTILHFPTVTDNYLLPLIEAINNFNLNFIKPLPSQKRHIFVVESSEPYTRIDKELIAITNDRKMLQIKH